MIKIQNAALKILSIVVLIGMIAAGYISWQRYNIEAKATTVEMVYDYNNILESASVENTSTDELFSLYKKSGITSLAIYDETLKKLMDHGYVIAYRGSDLILKNDTSDGVKANHIYVQASNIADGADYFNEMKSHVKVLMRKEDFNIIKINGVETLELNANYERMLNMPLGIFKTTVKKASEKNMFVVLRPMNIPHVSREQINQFLEVCDSSDKVSAVLFQGKEVLGYKNELDYVAGELKRRHLPVVLIEAQNQLGFERQDGLTDLAQKMDYDVIRLYAMSKDELIKLDPKEAASRFYISTIERNIRMNLFPSYKFAVNGETLSETNARYISDVADRLEAHGFSVGKASIMEPYFPDSLLRVAVMIGAASLCVIFLAFMFPFFMRHIWPIEFAFLLITQLLYWGGHSTLSLQLLALGCAVGTPVIIISLFLDYCVRKKKNAFAKVGWMRLFTESVALLWCGGLLSLAGALYISGLLGDIRFFLEMEIFRGVKLTFVLPLICVSVIYIQKFPFFGRSVASGNDFIQFIKNFCRIDIKLGLLAGLAIIGMAGIIFVGRSGNNGAPVPQFEVELRRMLESVLYARPREKEFLFGHPAIIVSLMALYHKWPQILHYIFIIAVTIGQGSMVETFAHMRSPFILSFIRGLDGLAAGTVSILIALVGLVLLTHMTKYLGARYGEK